MTDKAIQEAMDIFKECQDAESHNRETFIDDMRFGRLGEQWPEAVKRQREAAGRPVLTTNKLNAIIRQVVNDARQNKPQIKTHPIDDKADPETAELIDGLIRNIEATSDADVAYDTAIECAVSGGFGYWAVNIERPFDDNFDADLAIRRIANPLSVYGDPRSTAADSSDWNVCFQIERLKKSVFERQYKGAKATDWKGHDWQSHKGSEWVGDDDVQVASYWTRDEVTAKILGMSDGTILRADATEMLQQAIEQGITVIQERDVPSYKVTQRVMTACEVLKTVDWKGKYIPIVPVYGDEVNIEGKRYFRSLIADAKDPMRMFNYWRTASTEMVALAPRVPYIGRKGAFDTDSAKWATANSASHAYIEYDGMDAPQRQGLPQQATAAIAEAMNASDDIKAVTGMYDASLGARSNETSGRAIMARQREGDIATFHFIDNVSRAIRHTGRILIDLMPKTHSTERIARIIGQDGISQSKQINRPYEVKGKRDDDGNPLMAMHDLRVGKYDVTVSSGPSFTTRREEAATQMMEFLRAHPDAAPIIGDLLAKNLDWPGADEIAKRLKGMLPAGARDDEDEDNAPDPEKQQMMEAIEAMKAHIAEMEKASADTTGKLEVDRYNAETNRMKVVAPAMGPEAIQAIVMQTLQDLLGQAAAEPEPMGDGAYMGQPAHAEPAEMPY